MSTDHVHILLFLLDYRSSESVLGICVRIIQYGMFLNVNFNCASSVIINIANNI